MISGLKIIAAELEHLATSRGISMCFTTTAVYKLCHRRRDPLPAFKTVGRGGGIHCDEVALEAWFKRQRFTFLATSIGATAKGAR